MTTGSGRDVEPGWVALPNLVEQCEVNQILAECDALAALPPSERAARDKAYGGTVHLERLDERIPLVAEITRRPALVDAVQLAHQGTDQLELDVASLRSPQPGHGGQALHIDSAPDNADSYVTAIVALCELTTRNGTTRVLPGSQNRPDLWRSVTSHQPHVGEQLLTGPAGTAFVLTGGLLHSGTPNRSSSPRPALQFVWRATEAVEHR